MSRYTEYMKEKVLCKYCICIISRGHGEAHLKTIKHIKNITTIVDRCNKN